MNEATVALWRRRALKIHDDSATAALKKGEYTKSPVKTDFGWHVIKLEDTRDVSPPSFDSVKDQLGNMLQNQMISDYVNQLRDKAKIELK